MLLEVKGLKKTFTDGTQALRGVDISAKEGEFIVILGPSGSGKTTLLRCINGLTTAEHGTIRFDDRLISQANLSEIRKQTGMIFQDFNLVNNLSSLNNVLSGLLGSSNKLRSCFYLFTHQQKIHALRCLDRVGLLEKAYTRIDQLSGGQKQRVGFARAIVKNPSLLLADEPVASLDPLNAHSILSLLRNIGREFGITIICNLHQVGLALEFSDRIVGISGGQIVFDAPTQNVDEAYVREIYNGRDRGLYFDNEGPGRVYDHEGV